MTEFHRYLAYAIPSAFGILVLLSIYAFVRNRDPGPLYWNLLGGTQAVVLLQLVVGIVLFVSGGRPQSNGPSWLHYIYGAVFPAIVLAIAHVQSRKREGLTIAIFGVATFLCTFSTLRALQTGLGID